MNVQEGRRAIDRNTKEGAGKRYARNVREMVGRVRMKLVLWPVTAFYEVFQGRKLQRKQEALTV